jgi:hypothetical protein
MCAVTDYLSWEKSIERHPDYFLRREAAKYIGVCTTTLQRLNIPKTRVGHRVYYKREVLDKWLEEQTEKPKKGAK